MSAPSATSARISARPRGRCASPAGSPRGRRRRRCGRRPRRGTGRTAPRRTWPRRRGSHVGWCPDTVERGADGADLAVHHPRRGDDVDPGLGLRDADLGVALEGGVVVDLAVRASSNPQWPWSVYSSRHRSAISTSESPTSSRRSRSATCTMPSGSEAPRPAASLRSGTPNRITAGNAEGGELGDLLAQRLAGVLHHAGQRRDRHRLVDALAHEERGDQVVDGQVGSRPPVGAWPAYGAADGDGDRESSRPVDVYERRPRRAHGRHDRCREVGEPAGGQVARSFGPPGRHGTKSMPTVRRDGTATERHAGVVGRSDAVDRSPRWRPPGPDPPPSRSTGQPVQGRVRLRARHLVAGADRGEPIGEPAGARGGRRPTTAGDDEAIATGTPSPRERVERAP